MIAKRKIRGGGVHLADTYLMYHAGRNCVVTIKRAYVGRRSWTEAWLWRRNYLNLAENQPAGLGHHRVRMVPLTRRAATPATD